MKKDTKLYLVLVVIVLAIIIGIYAFKYFNKDNTNPTEKLMQCIAGKSVLYIQTGCGHCEDQKAILGTYYSLFTNINCLENQQECAKESIRATPTWIITGQKYEGKKTISELKQLTGC